MNTVSGCKVDFHVKVLDDAVVERAKRRGLDALIYAPHFTQLPDIEARAERFSDDELVVIPGREIFTGGWRNRRHILGLALTDPIPDFIPLHAAMAELERQNALVLIPHPSFFTISLEADDIALHRELIDAVELYNPKCLPPHVTQAKRLIRQFDLPTFGSSYAHLRGTVGEVWTEFEDITTDQQSILDAVRSRAPRRVGHQNGFLHRLQCSLEFLHLFWENSAEKFRRVVIDGQVPTHPDQDLYGGRFDED